MQLIECTTGTFISGDMIASVREVDDDGDTYTEAKLRNGSVVYPILAIEEVVSSLAPVIPAAPNTVALIALAKADGSVEVQRHPLIGWRIEGVFNVPVVPSACACDGFLSLAVTTDNETCFEVSPASAGCVGDFAGPISEWIAYLTSRRAEVMKQTTKSAEPAKLDWLDTPFCKDLHLDEMQRETLDKLDGAA